MEVEPSSQLLPYKASFASPGGRFKYTVLGPCSRLFDREQLPYPSCSLVWRGKQPAWNRIGKRFVPDLATSRCPSYAVIGQDSSGNEWQETITLYSEKLTPELRQWWVTKKPVLASFPGLPTTALITLSSS